MQLSHHKNSISLSIWVTFHEALIVSKSVVMSAWKRGEGRERREGEKGEGGRDGGGGRKRRRKQI